MIQQKQLDQNESETMNVNVLDCESPQEFNTSDEFFNCFQELFDDEIRISICLVLLIFFTIFLNLLVIVLLVRKRSRMTIFDKLIISLCFCDCLTALLDTPFFSLIQIFGYWPFSYSLAVAWCAFDSGLCTINMTCVLHMTYVRLRSLQAPSTYERELLIRKPFITALIYWAIEYSIWIPITVGFGVDPITAEINYQPIYMASIIDFFLSLFPLVTIILIGFYIVVLLYKHRKKSEKRRKMAIQLKSHIKDSAVFKIESSAGNRTSTGSFISFINVLPRLGPHAKFLIIIISYWILWLPLLLIYIFGPLCQCVPDNVGQLAYWLTYLASMTNPIMVLLFNSNVSRLCLFKLRK